MKRKTLSLVCAAAVLCTMLSSMPHIVCAQQSSTLVIPAHLKNKWGSLSRSEEVEAEKLLAQGVEQDKRLARSLKLLLDPKGNPLNAAVASKANAPLDAAFDELFALSLNMRQLDWIRAKGTNSVPSESWVQVNASLGNSKTQMALRSLAPRTVQKWSCTPFLMQVSVWPEYFVVEYGLANLERNHTNCGAIPLEFYPRMQNDQIKRLSALVGQTEKSIAFASLAKDFYTACEDKAMNDVIAICPWLREKIEIKKRILPNFKKNGFYFTSLEAIGEWNDRAAFKAWLDQLVPPQHARVKLLLAALKQNPAPRALFGYWKNKEETLLVLRPQLAQIAAPKQASYLVDYDVPSQFLVVVSDTGIQWVALPQSLGQYDDGVLIGLSDVDQDGNIEAWLSAEWGECDGEGLVPGRDCAIPHYYRFEQFGERFLPFVQGARPQ
ncbi:hypothetical protein RF679_00645 [Undibacterium cyanobacteriorum]|uniref:Uncharacterized protein n=1 Tax=Undibacterium cyanobacteriorum TaxID=3073561 RepID=A0ABY9RIY8_9BURK|nr:hypothetical protein [Undibacterium sp. 20NA77.5]WMW80803.1 hypothetical protein RF679_00645 [Undibacterium sp. 20NA77.5]